MNTIQPPANGSLTEMFQMQKRLLERYSVLEDMPQLPLDLSMRKNQELLKKFTDRLVEELSEAYTQYLLAYHHVSANMREEAQEHIELFNEELADAWHFMLEILLVVGVDVYGVRDWITGKIHTDPIVEGILMPDNLLKGLLIYSGFLNQRDGKMIPRRDRDSWTVFSTPETVQRPEVQGGAKVSDKQCEDLAVFSWEVTHRLKIAMNQLKGRDWYHADDVKVNLIEFNESLFEALVALCRMMVYIDKGELSIFNSFVLKDRILWERLKTQ